VRAPLRLPRAGGFLKGLIQGVNSQCVHMFPSLTPLRMPQDASRRPEACYMFLAPCSAPEPSSYVVDTTAALVRSGVVRVVRAMAPLLARVRWH
jgi:hypothetical protein